MPLAAAPPTLTRALKDRLGDIAAPGAAFDATDVIITGRSRRLIFIWNREKRWIVATEHGGRGYNDPLFAYDLGQEDRSVTLAQERVAFPDTLCSTAISLLDVQPSKP